MAQEIFILVGDFGLGAVQRQVLHWSIRTFTQPPCTLLWATELPLDIPACWQVKPEVALPLLAKLWILRQNLPGPAFYLDGNLILRGNLAEVLEDLAPGKILVPQRLPLKSLQFFAVSVPPDRQTLWNFKLHPPDPQYGPWADFSGYSHNLCGPSWQPMPYGQNPDADLIDCAALQHRPWYKPVAPGWDLWLSQVKQAFQTGVLSGQEIYADVLDQKLHPDWLDKLHFALGNRDFFDSQREAAVAFMPPEIRVSQTQQQQLRDHHYPLPQRSRIRVLLSSYLWAVTLPTRFNRLFRQPRAEER